MTLVGVALVLATASALPAQDVRPFSPSFNASSLFSHDPDPHGGDITGWPVNPDNMPIGNGRVVALVWGDGNHANTSGVGLLLARDDAWTSLNQLVKLGRLRVQLDPDPFLNASAFNQTLDLETGEVLISVTSRAGDHTASLRVAPSAQRGVDAVTVELLSSSVPVRVSVRLELWRYDGPFPSFMGFSTFVTGDCLNESQKMMQADVVLRRSEDLVFFTRNNDSPVWRETLERQLVMPAMPAGVRDPLLHRQFGALVQGDGSGWSAAPAPCLQHCCHTGCGSRTLQTTTSVISARLAITTHTNQTATAEEWTAQLVAIATAAQSASATQLAAAHSVRKQAMAAFWARSFVSVGGAKPPPPVDPKAYTVHTGMIGKQPPTETFSCSAADSCTSEAAARCTELGSSGCQSFSYDPAWNPLAAELFAGGLATASHNPAWTLWVKVPSSSASSVEQGSTNRTDPPFALNQNYLLFRYLQLIQGNGSTAIHFNGGIIDWGATGDPGAPHGVDDHGSPDYRQWGGGLWFQNVRMAYYPNLADNDADQLVGLFRHYVDNTMEVMKARCKSWFKHGGLFFSETSYWWGSYRPADYGCDRQGVPDVENPYMWHHIEGGIELSQLMVRHWHYTQDEAVLKAYTLPWTDEVLKWYDLHYPRNPNGTILMLNAKACESYNHCTNPAPQIAGLQMVVSGLRTVPAVLLGETRVAFLANFSKHIPDIPLMESCQAENSACGTRCGKCSGSIAPAHTVQIAPCLINLTSVADAGNARGGFVTRDHTVNHEAVETYPIWPYEIRSLYANGNPVGQNTQDWRRYGGSNTAWDYNAGLVPAVLGGQVNAEMAYSATLARVSTTFDGSRFPGYALVGCCADGAPQMENTGIVRATLQKMLLTADNPGAGNNSIYLLPAWPKDRDVSFSLQAPLQTTVSVQYSGDGKLSSLVVSPPSRRKDIVMPPFLQGSWPNSDGQ